VRTCFVDISVNSQVENRDSVSSATPEAEMTYVMKPTPSAWQDSAHAQRDIHRSPASAVTEICLLMSGCVLKRNGSKQIARSKLVGAV